MSAHPPYSPENPPPLRRDGESVEDYRVRCGWDEPKASKREQVVIPIAAAERIAKEYGYDQVVIVGRRVGGFEHCTTYGVDAANCSVAARIGDFFKFKLMGWKREEGVS